MKAKEVSKRNPELIPIFYKDYYSTLLSKFKSKFQEYWQNSSTKLRQVKEDLSPWLELTGVSREEEVIINRLRTGHTKLTHGYLMSDEVAQRTAPICHFCKRERLTIEHIFLQCPVLENHRRAFPQPRNYLKSLVGSEAKIHVVFRFLRDLNMYNIL